MTINTLIRAVASFAAAFCLSTFACFLIDQGVCRSVEKRRKRGRKP